MKLRAIWTVSLVAALVLSLASPVEAQPWTVVMSGLDNPRGLTWVTHGDDDDDDDNGRSGAALYVAEAGKGGTGHCDMVRGETQCAGATGAVSRLWRGVQERVVTGLPSYAPPSGAGATGPHDVSFSGSRGYVVVGLGGDLALRTAFGMNFGWIFKFRPNGRKSADVDVAAYEASVNPGGPPVDSNPHGLLEGAGRRYVIEAGGNAFLRVHSSDRISTFAIFPSRAHGRDTDAVPTSVAFRRGAYYVGELTGFPFPEGGARVYRVRPGRAPEVFLDGFTAIIDLDFDREGNLYVLQFASGPGLSGPGRLIRVAPEGTRTIVADGLAAPTSVAIGPDGDAYVSNCGACPSGAGEVIRIDLPDADEEEEDD